jgi:hypothetical protein
MRLGAILRFVVAMLTGLLAIGLLVAGAEDKGS